MHMVSSCSEISSSIGEVSFLLQSLHESFEEFKNGA